MFGVGGGDFGDLGGGDSRGRDVAAACRTDGPRTIVSSLPEEAHVGNLQRSSFLPAVEFERISGHEKRLFAGNFLGGGAGNGLQIEHKLPSLRLLTTLKIGIIEKI